MKTIPIKDFVPSKKEWFKYTKIAIPTILGALLFSINSIVDNVMAGSLSTDTAANARGMSAIALFANVNAVFQTILGAVVGVMTSIIVQYSKTDQNAKIKNILKMTWIIVLGTFFMIYIVNFFAISHVVGIQSTDSKVVEMSQRYSRVVLFALLFIFLKQPMLNLLTAQGKTRYVFVDSVMTVGLNIALNLIFTFYIEKTLFYLALATTVSSAFVSVCLFTIIFAYNKQLRMNIYVHFDKEVMMYFFKRVIAPIIMGLWATIMILRQVIWTYGDKWDSNVESAKAIASIGGVQQIFTSLNIATTPITAYFVSSLIGRGEIEQAKKNSRKVIGYMSVLAMFASSMIMMMTLWVYKVHIFHVPDQYIDIGKRMMLVYGMATLSWTMQGVFMSFLDAGGRSNIRGLVTFILGMSQTLWGLTFVLLRNSVTTDFVNCMWIFYAFELVNVTTLIIIYIKVNWAVKITKESKIIEKELYEKNN